jgi:hypothetical protein
MKTLNSKLQGRRECHRAILGFSPAAMSVYSHVPEPGHMRVRSTYATKFRATWLSEGRGITKEEKRVEHTITT